MTLKAITKIVTNQRQCFLKTILVVGVISTGIYFFTAQHASSQSSANGDTHQQTNKVSKQLDQNLDDKSNNIQQGGAEKDTLKYVPASAPVVASSHPDKKAYYEALKRNGYGMVDEHTFKTPYVSDPPVDRLSNYIAPKAPGKREVKVISLHNWPKNNAWFTTMQLPDFTKCPYSECEYDNRGLKKREAALVWFNCRGMSNPPKYRPPGQLWSVFCIESPVFWDFPDYPKYKDAFNATASYRHASDFFMPWVQLALRSPDLLFTADTYVQITQRKSKTAVWFVTNCIPARLKFVKEMQKYIDVDIYGGCGPLKCSRKDERACLTMLNTTYKFYLAFENSFCKDQVSEKFNRQFFNRTQIIPVWKGGLSNEADLLPPNVAVNGNAFKTAKDLALYLKALAADTPRYAKMLEDKDKIKAIEPYKWDWCTICKKLHTQTFGYYKDIRKTTHDNNCRPLDYRIK